MCFALDGALMSAHVSPMGMAMAHYGDRMHRSIQGELDDLVLLYMYCHSYIGVRSARRGSDFSDRSPAGNCRYMTIGHTPWVARYGRYSALGAYRKRVE